MPQACARRRGAFHTVQLLADFAEAQFYVPSAPPPAAQRSTLAALPYLSREALLAWWNDDVPRLGASLAYYTLFAIAPVLLVAIAIAGAVFGEEAVRGEIVGQLDELLGRDGAQAVQALLEGARRDTGDLLATVLGGITFALAATGAFLELQTALNTIWRVKPKEKVNVASFLWDRVRSFALVVAIGFLLLVSLAVSAALAALNTWLNRSLPGMPLTLWSVVNLVLSLVVIGVLFAMLYRFLPDRRLEWRHVIVGALVTTVLFSIGKQVIGLYLGQSTTSSTYGAAGSVVVLLLWVYYSSQVVLLGAEFTRVYTEHYERRRPPPQEFAEKDPHAVKPSSDGTS
jgi:membrane protein